MAEPTTPAGDPESIAEDKTEPEAAATKPARRAGKKEDAAKDYVESDDDGDSKMDDDDKLKPSWHYRDSSDKIIKSEIRKLTEELGDEYDERIVRHLLTWRAEHWKIFRSIAFWDAKYGPAAVTIALRQLGYQPSVETTIAV